MLQCIPGSIRKVHRLASFTYVERGSCEQQSLANTDAKFNLEMRMSQLPEELFAMSHLLSDCGIKGFHWLLAPPPYDKTLVAALQGLGIGIEALSHFTKQPTRYSQAALGCLPSAVT